MAQTLRLVQEVPLPNTHFEGGTTGWSNLASASTFAASTEQRHSGAQSLKLVTATSVGRGAVSASISVLPSTTYIFSAWVYITAGSFNLQLYDDATPSSVTTSAGAADSTWRQVFVQLTTPANATIVTLSFVSTTAVSTGYFDDVRLYAQRANFQDVTDFGLRELSEYRFGQPMGSVKLVFDTLGSSISDMLDNFIAMGRALITAKQNRDAWWRNAAYSPVFLQWMPPNSTYMLQTEVLGLTPDSDGSLEKIIAQPQLLLSNRIENVTVPLLTRGYWEELTPVAVGTSPFTADNATGTISITGLRGDMSRQPLRIKTRVATTVQSQIIAALKANNTPADFIHHFDLHTDAGTGYTVSHNATFVANRTNVALVNGKGARVTPTSALDSAADIKRLITVTITSNTISFTGRYRALIRVKDNAATPKAYLRVKGILVDSSGTVLQASDYWGTAVSVTEVSPSVGQSLVDCGVGNMPPSNMNGATPYRMGIEIYGYTTDGTFPTFDPDELYLLPAGEGDENGLTIAYLPTAMGNGAVPDGVLDSHDRTPDAYMVDASDVILVTADITSGVSLYGYPNISQVLYLITRRRNDGGMPMGVNNTVTIDSVPRYRLARGS